MQVNSINNNVQFSGYVDKSVTKYVRKAVKSHCDYIAHTKAQNYEKITTDEIKATINAGDNILKTLNSYMANMGDDIGLFIRELPDYSKKVSLFEDFPTKLELGLKHPVIKDPVIIADSSTNSKLKPKDYYGILKNFDIDFAKNALSAFSNITDRMTKSAKSFFEYKILERATTEIAIMSDGSMRKLSKKAAKLQKYMSQLDAKEKNFDSYTWDRATSYLESSVKKVEGASKRKALSRSNLKLVRQQLKEN